MTTNIFSTKLTYVTSEALLSVVQHACPDDDNDGVGPNYESKKDKERKR